MVKAEAGAAWGMLLLVWTFRRRLSIFTSMYVSVR
jgi:uncharacterized protein (TIGR03382 family)